MVGWLIVLCPAYFYLSVIWVGKCWRRKPRILLLAAYHGMAALRLGLGLALLGALVRAARPAVMVNGLPGAMGREVAAACLRRGLHLVPVALTGPGLGDKEIVVDDGKGGSQTKVQSLIHI